jgi:hypothetical protein
MRKRVSHSKQEGEEDFRDYIIRNCRKCSGTIALEDVPEDKNFLELYHKLSSDVPPFFDFKSEQIEKIIFDVIFIVDDYDEKNYKRKVKYLISKIMKDAETFYDQIGGLCKIKPEEYINIFYIKHDRSNVLVLSEVYNYLNISEFYEKIENTTNSTAHNGLNLWEKILKFNLREDTEKILFHFFNGGENVIVDEESLIECRELNIKINIIDFSNSDSTYLKELENFTSFDLTKATY